MSSNRHAPRQTDLETGAAGAFESGLEGLDVPTRARLAQARARALDAYDARSARSRNPLGIAVPVGVLAAAALAAWIVSGPTASDRDAPLGVADASDLEMLLGEEDLELYEDLEFYAWLEEQGVVEAPPAAGDDIG